MARLSSPLAPLLLAWGGALLPACSFPVPGVEGTTYRCATDDDCLVEQGYRCSAEGVCALGAAPADGGHLADGGPDAGQLDPDAGPDAGPRDGGAPGADGGPPDGGGDDAGDLDAGDLDAGDPDAGDPDAGLPGDAGLLDAGPLDAGPLDGGAPRCGDGVVATVEACDDGNADNHDACTTACEPARCGDGLLQPGEACDDGNTGDDDGCSATCALEEDRRCFGEPSVCADADRVVTLDPNEDWDDEIDDIDEGDLVFLRAGTYGMREDIGIDLTLVGEPGAVIEGDSGGPALKIKSGARVHIQGVTLRHTGENGGDYPVRLEGGSELTLVDVHVGPSSAVGVFADDNNNNRLTVLRSRVEGNARGGVRSGKSYHIVGNVIVDNGDDSSDVGGARLLTSAGQFGFNTLVGNRSAPTIANAVHCDELNTPVTGSILWDHGALGPTNVACALTDTSTDTDPLFVPDGSYRLSPTSPLIDQVSAAPFDVPRDRDGDLRPLGTGYDLGADEAPEGSAP